MGFFKTPSVEQRKKRRGLFRAAGYLLCLSGVFTFIQVRQARAEVGDRTVEVGREMMALASATQHDVNRISLNGQSLFMGSSLSDDRVSSVLDRYEAMCQKNRAQPADEWRGAAAKTGNEDVKKGPVGSAGIVRSGDASEGAVICFTKTDASKPTFSEAVHTFAQTGELGALGAVRYVYARTSDKGNTVVLTAWTDDQFNLKSFMGDKAHTTDCPGSDFDGLPRPDGSIRVISGRVENTPFGLNVYKGQATPAEVVAGFDRTLTAQGWFAIDPELERLHGEEDKHHPIGRAYEKDGVVLSVASHVEPGSTFTTMGLSGLTRPSDTGVDGKKMLLSTEASKAAAKKSGEGPGVTMTPENAPQNAPQNATESTPANAATP